MTIPLFERQVTVFRGKRGVTPVEQLPLGMMLARMQDGTYQPHVEALQAFKVAWGKAAYDEEKGKSYAFTPCCAMSTRKGKVEWPDKLISTTGIVYFDIDDVDDPEAVKTQLASDPRVCFTFLSPSARGVKVGVAADGITGPDDYKTVWAALLKEFQQRYGLAFKVDDHVKFLNALCYVSYDPQMYINPEATPFVMPPSAPTKPRKARPLPAPGTDASDEARAQDALRYIPADDYEIWLAVGMALHSTGWPMARSLWDTWSATSQKYEEKTQDAKWSGFVEEGGRTIATMFDLAKKGGYRPPKKEKATMRVPRAPASVPMMSPAAATPAGIPAEDSWIPAPQDPDEALLDELAQLSPLAYDKCREEKAKALGIRLGTLDAEVKTRRAPRAAPATEGDGDDSAEPEAWEPTWWDQLLLSDKKIPLENFSNLLLIMENHEHWQGRFWFDVVRFKPMLDDVPIDDNLLVEIARWFGLTIGMPLYYIRRLENCVRAVCQKTSRDLLAEWLQALPAWDNVERLTEWLSDVASVPKTTYSMELSRLMPTSLVARALNPGCQYRYVVILEGTEDSGKTKLVKTLVSPTWYREFSVSMENKEAHMLLQGAWMAELGELATLSRTEEAKLKSFITLEEDVWIPKYSNFPQHVPRRTVFVGTINPEEEYLRGQTGNTRFLPIKTGVIECADLEAIREQLFAEALVYFKDHPDTWWQLSEDAEREAQHQREERRQSSVFEDDLANWLDIRRHDLDHPVKDGEGKLVEFARGVTTWEEIAQYYLRIEKEKWKDRQLQMQIALALRAKGWEGKQDRQLGDKQRYWRQRVSQPQ